MRATIFSIIFIILGLFDISIAQVIEGDVSLRTQAEVQLFEGTSITGYLLISGDDIIDLSPLIGLTSVGYYLNIDQNASLANLDGLSNLTTVGSGLHITHNYSLANLDGLSNITSVSRYLHIGDNASLQNLDGLSNLTAVGDDLHININASLANLDGLSNLTTVSGDLTANYNGALNAYCGLFPLLSSNGLQGSFSVAYNLVNRTQQQIIDDGPCITTAIAENELLPNDNVLHQNFPNPFNPITTIGYDLPEQAIVNLTVYDLRGQEVMTLEQSEKPPGIYEVQWNGMNQSGNQVSTGVYFCRLHAGEYNQTIKMVYLR